jgi:hypothetical protein
VRHTSSEPRAEKSWLGTGMCIQLIIGTNRRVRHRPSCLIARRMWTIIAFSPTLLDSQTVKSVEGDTL